MRLFVIAPSGCAHDCGGKCLLHLEVIDGRIVRIMDGARVDEVARGLGLVACGRGLSYVKRLYSPWRLTRPLERRGSKGSTDFKRISWDDALDRVAKNLEKVLEEYGNEAVLNMGGSGSYPALLHDTRRLTTRFLNLIGGSVELYGSYSYEAAKIASVYTYGTDVTDHPREDLTNSRLIIMWGWNPFETFFGSNTITYLKKSKEKGTRLVCIDPRRTPSAEFAGEWVPIRPGTDTALASAMAHTIIAENLHDRDFIEAHVSGFDKYADYIMGNEDGVAKTPEWASNLTGIPPHKIRSIARDYACMKPAALIPGWGPQRTAYGEQFIRSTAALASITGNIGLAGGNPAGAGIGPGPTHASVSMPVGENRVGKRVPAYQWADLVLKGVSGGYPSDIKAAYIAGRNILNQHGDANKAAAAFKKLELVIVHEHFLTPTARYADIILPAAMFPERSDILLPWSGHGCYAIFQSKAVNPPADVKTDLQIFTEVASRVGLMKEFNPYTEEEWLRHFADKLSILDYEGFKRRGICRFSLRATIPFSSQIRDGEPFPTHSGKIELYSKRLAEYGSQEIPPVPKYLRSWEGVEDPLQSSFPLQLITPKSIDRIHSSLPAGPFKIRQLNRVWISPRDAEIRKISQGETVKIFNARGEVLAEAYVTDKIIPGVISLEEGSWYSPNKTGLDIGGCPNTLTSDRPTPLAKGATTHTSLVQITRWAGHFADISDDVEDVK